ncbi:MAG: DUF1673 domain-containing protein [Methanomicrobiaceae archaeon]|nr:DUF1673 domain-containing protein [Methanomicrobiaceae archaeon]
MPLADTIRAYLGWCPAAGSMQANPALHLGAGTADASGGRDGIPEIDPGWWKRYHNQLLVMAVNMSLAAAFFLLIEDASGYSTALRGIAVGTGVSLGLLLSLRKLYARIAAGEFVGARRTRRQRIARYIAVPALSLAVIGIVVYFALNGMCDTILALMLGVSLYSWAAYGFTLLWERQHRTAVHAW